MARASSVREGLDLVDLCRRAAHHAVKALEAGQLVLRIPKVADRLSRFPRMHFHMEPQVCLQVVGRTQYLFPHEEFWVAAGEVGIIPRTMPHVDLAERAGRATNFCAVEVGFHGEGLMVHASSLTKELETRRAQGRLFPTRRTALLQQVLDETISAYHGRTPNRDLRIRGAMLDYFGSLLDVLESHSIPDEEGPFVLTRCRQLVLANLSDPALSVRRLARDIHCSPDYLSNLFRRVTHNRLTHYINVMRIAKARELLEKTSLSVSEIAWACGYSDPGYFTRVFKREVGRTPRQFRKRISADGGPSRP